MLNNYSRKLLARIVASSHGADLLSATSHAPWSTGLLSLNHALFSTTTRVAQADGPSTPKPTQDGQEKKIYGSILLERLPVVAPPRPQWFLDYEEWQMKDREQGEDYKFYTGEFERLRTGGDVQLVGDMEGDPTTHKDTIEAAENGDITSPWRRLDTRIFFLCKLRQGNTGADGAQEWTFPAVQHRDGETIRQTAERALEATVDTERVKVYVLGNQPACHFETDDALIFYFRYVCVEGFVYCGRIVIGHLLSCAPPSSSSSSLPWQGTNCQG